MVTLLTLLMLLPLTGDDQPAAVAASVGVMSFNIRYGTANDGANHWKHRKENVVTTIRDFSPDIVGTQETLKFQADFLRESLPDYQYIGRSREQNDQGEQCGILFLRKRFDLLESGHFWLSETPNVPASRSWDSSLPRMATWAKLFDRKAAADQPRVLYVVNTHFDHRGAEARAASADVILGRLKRFEPGIPVVLTGDFNAGPGSVPIRKLSEALTDTYAATHDNENQAGTFGGFQGRTDGARIDFIFVSGACKVRSAEILRRQFEGRDPSDHFPVVAEIELGK